MNNESIFYNSSSYNTASLLFESEISRVFQIADTYGRILYLAESKKTGHITLEIRPA